MFVSQSKINDLGLNPEVICFYIMTVFERLQSFYASIQDVKKLSVPQKGKLGRLIIQKWFQSDFSKVYELSKIKKKEDTGVFIVIQYPDIFTSTIDFIIKEYYNTNILGVKKRKRKPVYSYKPINSRNGK